MYIININSLSVSLKNPQKKVAIGKCVWYSLIRTMVTLATKSETDRFGQNMRRKQT